VLIKHRDIFVNPGFP